MYVKTITLEGFKSYGKRQEIKGFDPEFNAITGLNGSGKSNILDAICFVLGITNLTQVRATSLQELVYKNGQAGITKASVTIVFDNSNRETSPLGYEQYNEISVTRQVVMGGKNKYLINGTNVQNKRVQDLFCSVQLNVNNPHFLIMQGRITKVLNMKPAEILSMIEEAAGTRMYENKKQMAQKTIEKKETKLKELNEVINEEITPKIEKLKEEQKQYLEYQRVNRELEKLTKLYVSWKYGKYLNNVQSNQDDVVKVKQLIEDTKGKITAGEEEVQKLDAQVEEMQKEKDEAAGAQLRDLEARLKEAEKNEARAGAQLKSLIDTINSEAKKIKQLEKNLKDDETALASKKKEQEEMGDVFGKLRETAERDTEALANARTHYQAVSSGMLANEEGENATLQEQLLAAKQEVAQAGTEKKQFVMQRKHFESEHKQKQQEMLRTQKDYSKDEVLLNKKQKEVEALQTTLSKLGIQEGQLENLQEERRVLHESVRRLKDKVANFEDRNPQLTFKYRDPEPNFNHSSVKGLVCMNLRLKNPGMARALQVAGGGRLFNVIVDTEKTGKKLLERGNLQKRTTFIPLNQISARGLPNSVVQLAQQVGGKENVFPALSLVEYDKELQPAMEFVFGQTFICRDMDIAKKVTFHPKIMKKSVTFDGDVMDPSGTLAGGAAERGIPILQQLAQLNEDRAELKSKMDSLNKIEESLKHISRDARTYNETKEKLELASHELEMVKKKLEQTTHHQYKEEVEKLATNIEELKVKETKCDEIVKEGAKKVSELENKVKNAKAILEKELKAAKAELDRLTKQCETSKEKWQQREQECQTLDMEVTELIKSIETAKSNLEIAQKELEEQQQKREELKTETEETKVTAQKVRSEVKNHKEVINAKSKEIQATLSRKEQLIKEKDDLLLEVKKFDHEVAKIEEQGLSIKQCIADLEEQYDWIVRDKKFFGVKGGAYDYTGLDMNHMGKTISNMEQQQKDVGRNINARAMNMLGREEEQYAELMRKKNVVENDKTKIKEVIKELDEKKNVALRKAWHQVNKDFGSIFSSLLPGARACLNPSEGKDVLDGLEIKVGFGDTWKESLGELSGGQRSLVALSLILSMLLFKPAPIYILDEVDAALDLSHTQNIGNMLKKHFKHSQFIIVSLKDGMFNNANVLFRTQFIDGMSTVTRHAQRS
ncbi:Structural maintenance of chromosomes protein [Gryllus bimaculatus]|nr:Structural maintenance of chromosomes protein [Gryllus bimaculatus]